MSIIAEPNDPRIKGNLAVQVIVAEGTPANPAAIYGKVRLYRRSRGWVCAGSMMRLQENDCWGVGYDFRSGGSGGESFTGPDAEIKAREAFVSRTVQEPGASTWQPASGGAPSPTPRPAIPK